MNSGMRSMQAGILFIGLPVAFSEQIFLAKKDEEIVFSKHYSDIIIYVQ